MKKRKLVKIMLLVLTLVMIPIISQVTVSAEENTVTAKAKNGWVRSGNRNYYYVNGRPISAGWHKINGSNCYFERNGRAAIGWLTYNNRRYYLNAYGRPYTGWQVISGKRHYFDGSGRAYAGWVTYSGKRYLLNSYGRVHYGWKKVGNSQFYFDLKYGYAYTGWKYINGVKHAFGSYGHALTGTRTINGITYRFDSYGRVISTADPVVYRALAIGESNYPGVSSDLSACRYDAKGIATICSKTGYSKSNYSVDASASKIRSLINSTYAGANSNDISLFYYTGHGASDGSLVTTNYEYLSPYTLASWLKQVPGNVVVILDSCYSGVAIGKSGSALQSFNDSVVAAFDNAEMEVKNENAKGGPMSTSKFRVLTACGQYESSYAYSKYSIFTYYLARGVGLSYGGNKLGAIYADSNRDRKITLKECYNYTYSYCLGETGWRQHVRCYPEGSNLKLFQR